MTVTCPVCGRVIGDTPHVWPGTLCATCALEVPVEVAAPEPETDTTTADTVVESEVTGAGTITEPTA